MAESVVSDVATRLGNLLVQEAIYLYGVSDQVQQLQTELKRMQCFLKDADARQNESEIIKLGVAEMKDLAYDAEDIIATYALKVGSKKGGGIRKILRRCACVLDEGITVHTIGSAIADIMAKLSNLRKSFEDYGIRELIIQGGGPSSLNETQRERRETHSHAERVVVGLEDDTNRLVEFLLNEKGVASVCGMGGLGKTTLAKMVYNHHEVKQYFDLRAWAYVSQQFQRRQVWEGILIGLLSPSIEERVKIRELRDEEIVERLRKVQQDQKCLVILDDIWNIEAWNSLSAGFSWEDTNSKILLTTRNKHVSSLGRGFVHELQLLNEEKSWELLAKIAISWREDSVTKTKMKKLGKEMVGYCGRLPLAITVLGGLLAAKQTHKEWEDVLRDVKSHKEDFRASEVLALSYNDLPSHLKPCFLYLAHFPEDFEIPTRELISMWLGEGFISRNQHVGDSEYTMENEGERYLRELVQRYMVQVGNIGSFGMIKTCRMHDLMRDFCISKAQAENFLQIASMEGNGGHIGKLRRLAINSKSGDNSLKVIKFNEYPYLRSLLYFLPYWDHYRYFNESSENALYFKESCFNVIKLLRVLNMENFGFYCGKLPKDIGYLIHLRFLSLRKSNIKGVPSSMGNLRCLETLDLRSSVRHVEVPNVFKKMEQLRHLYLPIQYRVSKKLELANLSYLQTLVNVEPKTIQIPTSFLFNRLRLRVWTFDTQPRDAIQKLVSSYPHIYNLYLFAEIRKLPEAHQLPQNLAKLTLRRCYLEEDPMSTLEKLPNLKILRIVLDAFVGKSIICCGRGFPLLQSLILDFLPSLEDLRVEEGAMPSLCHLKIHLCPRLEMIPDGLRFITTLQELEIRNMPKSFKDRLDRGGPDFYKVQHVPSRVFQNCDRE